MTSLPITDLHPSQYKAVADLYRANQWPIGEDLLWRIGPHSLQDKHPFRHFFAIPDPEDESKVLAAGAVFVQGSIAGIGLILVRDDQQRKGLGTKIFQKCLDVALEDEEVKVVWLTATKAGAPVYRRVGFETVGDATVVYLPPGEKKERVYPPPEGHHFSHYSIKDTPQDAFTLADAALGQGRRGSLIQDASTNSVLLYCGDRLVGWAGIMIEKDTYSNIGPVIIENDDVPLSSVLALLDEIAAVYAVKNSHGMIITIDDRFGAALLKELTGQGAGWKKVDMDIVTMVHREKSGSREWYDDQFGPERRKGGPVQLAYLSAAHS